MSLPNLLFLCDDQVSAYEKSWISELTDAGASITTPAGDRWDLRHIPSRKEIELNSSAIIEHFRERILAQAKDRKFGVVTDARFGQRSDGGAVLLLQLASGEAKDRFLRGLVYSIEPELGAAKGGHPKIQGLRRPTRDGGVAYQAAVIMRYFATGTLQRLHELREFCQRAHAAVDEWLATKDVLLPREWVLGNGPIRLFTRDTARLFTDLDDYLAAQKGFRLFKNGDDLLHDALCPYQSLHRAGALEPWHSPVRNPEGGWLRLAFELSDPAGFPERVKQLKKGATVYQQTWIDHHAGRMQAAFDRYRLEPELIGAHLRLGVEREARLIDSFQGKPLEIYHDRA